MNQDKRNPIGVAMMALVAMFAFYYVAPPEWKPYIGVLIAAIVIFLLLPALTAMFHNLRASMMAETGKDVLDYFPYAEEISVAVWFIAALLAVHLMLRRM
jgi:protein-S-isoprenylcysteine O-methyltransferase Ste14